MIKTYSPADTFNFGKYYGENCKFIYTFHPEYFEWLMINHDDFCINTNEYENLHTHPFAGQLGVNAKYYNTIELMEYDTEVDALGTTPMTLRQFLTKTDLIEKHYFKNPDVINTFSFSSEAIRKNNLKLEVLKLNNR